MEWRDYGFPHTSVRLLAFIFVNSIGNLPNFINDFPPNEEACHKLKAYLTQLQLSPTVPICPTG